MKEGREAGLEQGREQGLKEGREEGRKNQRKIVLNLYKKKMSIEEISEITELSKEEVEQIIKNN